MKLICEETRFHFDQQIDINYLRFRLFTNPLVIATREAQIYRILEWIERTEYDKPFTMIGWWDLVAAGYITTTELIISKWKEHDAVILLDKNRCSSQDIIDNIILVANYV